MSNMIGSLFNRTIDLMGKSLNLRLAKHSMTATNLANMDIPGYRIRDLKFEETMQQALSSPDGRLTMRQTNSRHMPVRGIERAYQAAQAKIEYSVYGRDNQGDDLVDIDQEMTKLAKNHLLYNATVQMLAKKLEALKYAISEGGRS